MTIRCVATSGRRCNAFRITVVPARGSDVMNIGRDADIFS
jgi:hypothetical protein